MAAVLAVIGLALGIPALLRARRGTHRGKTLAVTGLVTSLVAIVVVVLTQASYASVIDEVERSTDEEFSSLAPSDGAPSQRAETAPEETAPAAHDSNEPATGRYVLAQLTVAYTGDTEGVPRFELTSVFHGSDARQYSDTGCSAVLADDAMDAPTLDPGGSGTSQFCMDVPPAAIAGGRLSVEPTTSFDPADRVFCAVP